MCSASQPSSRAITEAIRSGQDAAKAQDRAEAAAVVDRAAGLWFWI